MNKKGAELSMNVIVIAALALIVFIVLIAVFGQRLGLFQKNTADTEAKAKEVVCGIGNMCLGAGESCDSAKCWEEKNPGQAINYVDCAGICCKKIEGCTA